jgi:outer membrane protein assembly factor BamB
MTVVRMGRLAACALVVTTLMWTGLCAVVSADGIGWRTDGSGIYADATPALEWAPDKNVVWKTPLAATSNSCPILVGDRIFTTQEPGTLVCLNANDGSLVWERSLGAEDLATPEELAQMDGKRAEEQALQKEFNKAQREMNQAQQAVKDKPEDAAAKERLAAARDKVGEINRQLAPYRALWYIPPARHDTNGYASCTPVSDGKHVWMVYGTGTVVCYDMDGNRVWAKFLEKPTNMWGHSTSPVLSGNTLIVHILNCTALDKDTGNVLWQTRVPENWGTPAVTSIGGTPVIITCMGDILRVSDGHVLAKTVAKLTYNSPVVVGNIAYFIEQGGKAVQLPDAIVDDKADCKVLWTTEPKKERYYSSPVIYDGLIYAIHQFGLLSCIDAADGKVVYEQDLRMGKGTCYQSICLAGGMLFAGMDNGTTVVFKPGRQYEEVARNMLEPYRGSLVFSGARTFVRGFKNMYCLGTQ